MSLATEDDEKLQTYTRADGGHTHAGGGCGFGGDCDCGGNCSCSSDDHVASDGGYNTEATTGTTNETKDRTTKAYELLHEEARRVYDIGESHYESWGWEVYSYTMTKSISAGVFMLPALLMAFGLLEPDAALMGVSSLVSAVFLALTGVLLILDLEQPTRFHWVLLRPNWNSWLVKGAYIITGFSAFLVLMVIGWLLGVEAIVSPVVLLVGAVLAAATAVYTAFLFSQSKGRDLWQSPAMPLHMFTQAFVTGASATAFLGLGGFEELVGPSRLMLAGGLVVHLALVASELFTPHQTEDAEEAAARIARGRFSTAFWAGGMALGVGIPLVALALSAAPVVVALAGVAALAGLFAYEYCWIIAPQTISLA